MNEDDVRTTFGLLLAGEPPVATRLDDVAAVGRRLRRRRRAYAAAGVAASLAVAAGGLAVATGGGHDGRLLPVRPAASGSAAPSYDGLSTLQRQAAVAIHETTPDGWTVDTSLARWEGPNQLTTTVDDGAGAAGLGVGVMVGAGWDQLAHPCANAEFTLGAQCTERVLADGSVLTVRALAHVPPQFGPDKGLENVVVVLTHPNGSGINATSSNFTIATAVPGKRYSPADKAALFTRTRTHPVYTAQQLADVVLAVDRATA